MNYYSLHLEREDWEKIVEIMNDNESDYEIISELPENEKSKNFLEDLAKNWFGLFINY